MSRPSWPTWRRAGIVAATARRRSRCSSRSAPRSRISRRRGSCCRGRRRGEVRILVVGAGIIGLCTAWALARDGHEVTVLEQGPVPNPNGSSVDFHRLIRYAYGDRLGYTRMVGEAHAAWERLWSDLGERLYVRTGTLL